MEVMTAVKTRRTDSLPGYVTSSWSCVEADDGKSVSSFFTLGSFFSTSVDDLEVDGPVKDSIVMTPCAVARRFLSLVHKSI